MHNEINNFLHTHSSDHSSVYGEFVPLNELTAAATFIDNEKSSLSFSKTAGPTLFKLVL